jgi:hypothetical protein
MGGRVVYLPFREGTDFLVASSWALRVERGKARWGWKEASSTLSWILADRHLKNLGPIGNVTGERHRTMTRFRYTMMKLPIVADLTSALGRMGNGGCQRKEGPRTSHVFASRAAEGALDAWPIWTDGGRSVRATPSRSEQEQQAPAPLSIHCACHQAS